MNFERKLRREPETVLNLSAQNTKQFDLDSAETVLGFHHDKATVGVDRVRCTEG